tara:strand:- start:289 stop:774 length:486 start_codon:yes stop_codon:yes gene_type:complete
VRIIYINPYSFGAPPSVSAPSAMNIDDAGGTDRSVTLNCGLFDRGRFTAVGTINVAHGGTTGTTFQPPLSGTQLNAFTIRAFGTSTGDAPTSYSWGFSQDGSTGGVSLTTGTTNTQNYEDQGFVVIDHSSISGDADFIVSLTGTNSGGSTAAPNVEFQVEV